MIFDNFKNQAEKYLPDFSLIVVVPLKNITLIIIKVRRLSFIIYIESANKKKKGECD